MNLGALEGKFMILCPLWAAVLHGCSLQKEKAPQAAKKKEPTKPKASPKAKAAPRAPRKKAQGEGTAEEEENLLPNDARKYFKQGQKFITPPNVRRNKAEMERRTPRAYRGSTQARAKSDRCHSKRIIVFSGQT